MSVSETKEVACKLCGREGHWKNLKGQPVFFHTQGHCKSDLPRLARCSYRGSWDSFTHPTKCRDCGGRCYFYQNQNGSKVFFDSLVRRDHKRINAAKVRPRQLPIVAF